MNAEIRFSQGISAVLTWQISLPFSKTIKSEKVFSRRKLDMISEGVANAPLHPLLLYHM